MRSWWLCGVPVIAMLVALSTFAEQRWLAGAPRTAALAEVLRLAVYWGWCRLAWRDAVELRRGWTPVARAALAAGLVTVALT